MSSPTYECPVCKMRYFNKIAQIQCHAGVRMLRTVQTISALAAIGFVGFIYLIPISYLFGDPIVVIDK